MAFGKEGKLEPTCEVTWILKIPPFAIFPQAEWGVSGEGEGTSGKHELRNRNEIPQVHQWYLLRRTFCVADEGFLVVKQGVPSFRLGQLVDA